MKTNWEKRFMELAEYFANWSKYPGRKVGAVIVDDRHTVLGHGYNGCPRGCDDEDPEKYTPENKYFFTCHAEQNAIWNAAKSLVGCTIYVPWFPCSDCAKAIIQAGIKKVVARRPDFKDPDWGQHFRIALQMFNECGVTVQWYGEDCRALGGEYEGYSCAGPKNCECVICDGCAYLRRS